MKPIKRGKRMLFICSKAERERNEPHFNPEGVSPGEPSRKPPRKNSAG